MFLVLEEKIKIKHKVYEVIEENFIDLFHGFSTYLGRRHKNDVLYYVIVDTPTSCLIKDIRKIIYEYSKNTCVK